MTLDGTTDPATDPAAAATDPAANPAATDPAAPAGGNPPADPAAPANAIQAAADKAAAGDLAPPADKDAPTLLSGDEWKARLELVPEELRGIVGRYPSEMEAYRALFEQRKALSTRIPVPDQLSSPEDLAEYRAKIGVPETPDGYELEIAEDVSEALEGAAMELVSSMHAQGATKAVAQAAVNAFVEADNKARETYKQQLQKDAEEADRSFRALFGQDTTAELAEVDRFMGRISPELKKKLGDTELANGRMLFSDPTFMEMMSTIRRSVSEDSINPPSRMEIDENATKGTLRDFYKANYEAITNPNHAEHAKRKSEYEQMSQHLARQQPGGNAKIGRSSASGRR